MANFHPLEVVGRGSETQLRVDEKLNDLISDLILLMVEGIQVLQPCACFTEVLKYIGNERAPRSRTAWTPIVPVKRRPPCKER